MNVKKFIITFKLFIKHIQPSSLFTRNSIRMSRIILFFNLILLSGVVVGQNWQLLDFNKTYFYKHIDSLHITNTIKFDSIQIFSSDTVFYVHSKLKLCDTCTNIPWQSSDGNLYHAFYPEIFGYTQTYSESTQSYQFSDGTIYPTAEVSANWTFNSSLGIAAAITDKYETINFGVLDSVKVVVLSSSDTILLSKNFGVLRYPDFDNSGKYYLITGFHHFQNSTGDCLPNMRQIYDFNAGDIFSYHNTRISFGTFIQNDFEIELHILENLSVEDTLKYRVKIFGWNKEYYLNEFGIPFDQINYLINDIDTLVILNNQQLLENNYSALLNLPDSINDYPLNSDLLFYTEPVGDGVNFTDFFLGSYELFCNEPFYVVSHDFSPTYGYVKTLKPFEFYGDSLCYPILEDCDAAYEKLGSSFGRISHKSCCFEGMAEDNLLGYIRDGVSYGTIYNYPNDLGVLNEDILSMDIYPIPTSNFLHINFYNETYSKNYFIQVYDLQGKIIFEDWSACDENIYLLDVTTLDDGLYFLRVSDQENNSEFVRFVVE